VHAASLLYLSPSSDNTTIIACCHRTSICTGLVYQHITYIVLWENTGTVAWYIPVT